MGLCQSKPRVGGGSNCQGLCRSKKKPCASPWPDLPPELAGDIFARLPSLNDRLRFRAVCRDWRLAAQRQRPLPPPNSTPWIHLGHGAYRSLSVSNGQKKTRGRFAAPGHCRAAACFGSWVLYEHVPTGRCFLRDPFPGAAPAIEVPCRYHTLSRRIVDWPDVVGGDCQPRAAGCYATRPHEHSLVKILACSPTLIVAIFAGSAFDSAPFNFACFRPGPRPRPLRSQLPFFVKPPPPPAVFFWSPPPVTASSSGDYYLRRHQPQSRADGEYRYKEIALHGGKVFAVSSTEELFAHELFVGNHQKQSLSCVELVISQRPAAAAPWPCKTHDCYHHHLVTSSDQRNKLLMVRWNIPHCQADLDLDLDRDCRRRVMDLQVFEADLERRRWTEAKDIGRQDLYVCRTGSRALAPATGSTEKCGRVFVMVSERASAAALCKCCHCQELVKNGVPSYCVYDMMSGEVSLFSLDGEDSDAPTKYVRSEWFFPGCRSLLPPRLVPSHVTCCHGGEAGAEAPPVAAPRPGAMDGAARPSTPSRRLPSPPRALAPIDGVPRTSGLLLSTPVPPVASPCPSRAEKLRTCRCPRRGSRHREKDLNPQSSELDTHVDSLRQNGLLVHELQWRYSWSKKFTATGHRWRNPKRIPVVVSNHCHC
ncbi:hypothetical protein BRADI_1g32475v3 [Brachypodium distachyon]|uniref:F-box domain-containing protein n=1 Tax=Brachypodium distachyon TaxID=15368 RepID=A0A0Q3JYL7_BRADI|nr:hypothetical protein BRADI_1g32475v3 [Brachypodium distachyon]